jgi:hypothetical protein
MGRLINDEPEAVNSIIGQVIPARAQRSTPARALSLKH